MYTPVNPVLLYKSEVLGGQNYVGMFSWWNRCRTNANMTELTMLTLHKLNSLFWVCERLTDVYTSIKCTKIKVYNNNVSKFYVNYVMNNFDTILRTPAQASILCASDRQVPRYQLGRGTAFPTRLNVRPAKTQAIWSQSSHDTVCRIRNAFRWTAEINHHENMPI